MHPERITALNPKFWHGANAELKRLTLEIVIQQAGTTTTTGTLSQSQCKICLKQIHTRLNGRRPGGLTDTQHTVVCRALAKINQSGLIRCAIPPAPIKAVRPSVLPDNAPQWLGLTTARNYLTAITPTFTKPHTSEDAALGLVYGLLQIGYGLEPALGIVSRLRQGDLNPEHGHTLRTPVHYLETGMYAHETVLPPWLRDRLKRVAAFNLRRKIVTGRRPEQQWAIPLPEPDGCKATEQARYQARFDDLKTRLTECHTKQFSAWSAAQGQPASKLLGRLKYFSQSLRLAALAPGMEPAMLEQLGKLPLPADTPAGLADFLVPSPAMARAPKTRPMDAITRNHQTAPWGVFSSLTGTAVSQIDLCDTLTADWAQDARFLLRAFATNLMHQFGTRRLAQSRLKALQTLITRYLDQANRIAPHTSVLYLALLWIGSKLHNQEIIASTAREYLSEIVIHGLLDYEAAFDLSDWDDEDVENARLLVLNRKKLSDSTRMNRQDRLGQFLTFCQGNGLLEEASLAKKKLGYCLTKRRNRVLGLAQFDQLQSTIAHSAASEAALVNTLLTLGFYGGLRSGEMLALRLSDIHTCGREIYVCIQRGKTSAARRKIPLHLIAPPRVCDQFRQYMDTRLAVARSHKAKPKKVAFIGPTDSIDGFARQDIIPPVIALLRYYIGPGFDMHTLRHGFGTWLMLRTYALKHPALKLQLLEQQHGVFSVEGEQRLTQLFQWSDDQPLRHDKIDLFIHIRKAMGHSHISVLLQNYMHGFGVIHQFLMSKM